MRKLDPVKHEKKRQEILAAAQRCFLRSGLSGASTAAICAEAGISPGHLYHYFESKNAIVAAIADARIEALSERFEQGGGSSIPALLSEMPQAGSPAESGLFFEMLAESRRNPEMAKIMHERVQSMRRLIADVLRHGQSRGEVKAELDPDIGAAAILALINAAKVVALQEPKQDAKQTITLFKLLVGQLLRLPDEDAKAEPSRAKRAALRSRST